MACCIAEALRRVCSAIHWVKSRSSRMLPHARNLKKFQRAAAQNFFSTRTRISLHFWLIGKTDGVRLRGDAAPLVSGPAQRKQRVTATEGKRARWRSEERRVGKEC